MKENIKNIILVFAIVVAGVSLPTSIISVMKEPIIITKYYETTIVEEYNNTIVFNNTVIQQFNNTIVINNTEYLPINRTIEYYFCGDIEPYKWFLNITYNITDISVIFISMGSNSHPSTNPEVWLYKNSVLLYNEKIQYCGIVGFVLINDIYDFKFHSINTVEDLSITIETIKIE